MRRSNCDEGVTSCDLGVGKLKFTPLSETICEPKRWSKSRLDRLIRKVDAGLPTVLIVLLVEVVRATFFESSQPV